MSYCVNCGVELDPSLTECPLCNTPVINPREMAGGRAAENYGGNGRNISNRNDISYESDNGHESNIIRGNNINHGSNDRMASPFPEEKGQVEVVKRKDVAILLTTVAVATAVVCGLLNLLVFSAVPWSLAIIGGCVLLWVILIPAVIYTRQAVYTSVFLDGIAMALYLYLLTYLTGSQGWFWGLGLPIVVLITVLVELMAVCLKLFPRSFLTTALYVFTALAVFCMGLEYMIDRFLNKELGFEWSAIVATVCVIVDIAIITLLSRRRLRNAVRRRLHF